MKPNALASGTPVAVERMIESRPPIKIHTNNPPASQVRAGAIEDSLRFEKKARGEVRTDQWLKVLVGFLEGIPGLFCLGDK